MQLETASVDLQKSIDVVDKNLVKKSKYKELKSKVTGLELKIPN